MGKIKLNLVSGAVVEKPLISAFKASNNSYVVLDNEMNGSMGLPIILVCKLENNKLIKIIDQNEWSIVKEYLKNIIAGNKIEFIKINEEIMADDIYYTQLTLPVPSFDALKNAYKVEEVVNTTDTSATIMDMFNTEPEANPTINNIQTPIMPEPVNNQVETPIVNVETPVNSIPVNPVVNEPVIEQSPIVENQVSIEPTVTPIDIVQPVMPTNPTPVVEPVVNPVMEPAVENVVDTNMVNQVNVSQENIFKDQKEAFMQACENMFDALVQKFEKELENRK